MSIKVSAVAMVVALALPLGAAAPSKAVAATPSDVYHAIGEIEAQLRAILEADFINADPVTDISPSARLPRHVYVKLVEIDAKLALMRDLQGLPEHEPLTVPAKLIGPPDVFANLVAVREGVDALFDAYGLSRETLPTEPKTTDKNPGDVYARLQEVVALMELAYLPATVPNDVFRVVATIRAEAELVASAVTGRALTAEPREATGKSPGDVFELAQTFSETLARLSAAHPDIAPRGGVFTPRLSSDRIRPADVRDALNLVLADLIELRVNAGDRSTSRLAAEPVGKTPSDVFMELDAANVLLSRVAR